MQVSSPRVCDIIIGKGGTGIYHPGNIFLRQQLTPIQIYYQKMEGHDKSVYLDIILKKIVASGRHFYKKDKESKKFRIVGLDERQGGALHYTKENFEYSECKNNFNRRR